VLVVGPSGAGKDSIIDGARAVLLGDAAFVFPQRFITRPSDAGGEVHVALTPAAFARRHAAGEFLLAWQAHDLHYALPAGIADDLAAGRTVIANVSRSVIPSAREKFQPALVVEITAPDDVLSARLKARGREAVADMEERLARAKADRPTGADVVSISNDGPLQRGIDAFVAFLRNTRPSARRHA
jgi:phosphonate metabolism protein PhnN/1,5-bisphosphokinase (PRPP-forming)